MIINESGGPYEKFRIGLQVSVAYKTDTEKVIEILKTIASKENLLSPHPKPQVRFRSFGDSGLHFELLVWVRRPGLRGEALHALHMKVNQAFEENGIEIPYAKQDVYLKNIDNTDLNTKLSNEIAAN